MKIPTRWVWTRKKEVAAKLLAEGGITSKAIAQELGVSRETIRYWKRSPEFHARIEQHIERFRVALSKDMLASMRKTIRNAQSP